jgi:hypothetical protein
MAYGSSATDGQTTAVQDGDDYGSALESRWLIYLGIDRRQTIFSFLLDFLPRLLFAIPTTCLA